MQFVRTIFWIAVLVVLALFTAFNWVPAEVLIWENIVLDTRLPVLILTAFALGFLPMWLAHRASAWRLRRRITALEASQRTLAEARAEPPRSPPPRGDHPALSFREEHAAQALRPIDPPAPAAGTDQHASSVHPEQPTRSIRPEQHTDVANSLPEA